MKLVKHTKNAVSNNDHFIQGCEKSAHVITAYCIKLHFRRCSGTVNIVTSKKETIIRGFY